MSITGKLSLRDYHEKYESGINESEIYDIKNPFAWQSPEQGSREQNATIRPRRAHPL